MNWIKGQTCIHDPKVGSSNPGVSGLIVERCYQAVRAAHSTDANSLSRRHRFPSPRSSALAFGHAFPSRELWRVLSMPVSFQKAHDAGQAAIGSQIRSVLGEATALGFLE